MMDTGIPVGVNSHCPALNRPRTGLETALGILRKLRSVEESRSVYAQPEKEPPELPALRSIVRGVAVSTKRILSRGPG